MAVAIRTEKIVLDSDGGKMPCYVARPEEGGSGKGLIVFQEAFGVNHHIRDVTERFARAGFTAVAPALFHRTDPNFECGYDDFSIVAPHYSAITTEGLAADTMAAFGWLGGSEGGATRAIAAIGYCLGGRAAFIANSAVPLKAAVSYYGGGIAPANMAGRSMPGVLDLAPNLNAPHLLCWGGLDKHIGPEQRASVAEALTAAGKPFVEATFSFADHGFFCNERSAYNEGASAQAWVLTLAFLGTYM